MKKVVSIFTDILITIIFTFATIFSVSTIDKGYTNFCGYTVVQVMSNSMVDSGINRGDVKMIKQADEYKIGDIIAFYYQSGDQEIILYHEIIGTQDDGFITKGSSNALPEANVTYSHNIIGRQVNNGNYKLLVSIPFRISLVLITYILSMSYIVLYITDIFKAEKAQNEKQNSLQETILPCDKKKKYKCSAGQKKLRKKLRRARGWKTLVLLFSLSTCCGLTAHQVFAASQNTIAAANKVQFESNRSQWTNSTILPTESYEDATIFENVLNNPNSAAGQAFNDAWNSKGTFGNHYVGNMDTISSVSDNLAAVFGNDAHIIIKRYNANSYALYITYEALNSPRGTIYPVYKTSYARDKYGNFKAIESWVGTCDRNIYSVLEPTVYAFNTESFKEI